MKVYSVYGLSARVWLQGAESFAHCSQFQSRYQTFIQEDVVEYIRRDCHGDDSLQIIVSGAAFGAFSSSRGSVGCEIATTRGTRGV